MADLYVIEVPLAPQSETRFLICFSGVFSNVGDLTFVPLAKVITGSRGQGFNARHSLEFCKSVVDFVRGIVSAGYPDKWIGSARVSRYFPSTATFEAVYTGQEVAPVVTDNPSAIRQAQDGTWRVWPVDSIIKTPRGFKMPYLVMHEGQPRGEFIRGSTKVEISDELFSDFPLYKAIVSTYPLAPPDQIPVPAAPVVEYVPTQRELDSVVPLPWEEYVRIPTAEEKRRRIFDPLFDAACKKTCEIQAEKERQVRLKQAAEAEAENIRKQKQAYLKADEDEARKVGGR